MPKDTYVSASEIGEYTFCKRGWWLRIHGLLPTTGEMRSGTHQHDELGRGVTRFHYLSRLSILLLLIGVLGISVYFLLSWII